MIERHGDLMDLQREVRLEDLLAGFKDYTEETMVVGIKVIPLSVGFKSG